MRRGGGGRRADEQMGEGGRYADAHHAALVGAEGAGSKDSSSGDIQHLERGPARHTVGGIGCVAVIRRLGTHTGRNTGCCAALASWAARLHQWQAAMPSVGVARLVHSPRTVAWNNM